MGLYLTREILTLGADKYNLKVLVKTEEGQKIMENSLSDELKGKITYVVGNAENKDDVVKAAEGVHSVFHNAHPNPVPKPKTPATEEETVIPAEKMIRAVLEACEVNKVKKLVVTLALPCVLGDIFKHAQKDTVYSHKDVAPITKDTEAEPKSKMMVEKILIEYLEKNPECPFEVVRIIPPLMCGPLLGPSSSPSVTFIKKILTAEVPGVPNVWMPYADVRDVAHGAYLALSKDGLHNKRIVMC